MVPDLTSFDASHGIVPSARVFGHHRIIFLNPLRDKPGGSGIHCSLVGVLVVALLQQLFMSRSLICLSNTVSKFILENSLTGLTRQLGAMAEITLSLFVRTAQLAEGC